MKIYTKQGDAGETALFDGRRVRKDDLRIETCGTIDELNSALGLAAAECGHASLRDLLGRLQEQLFVVGADLATPGDADPPRRIKRIGADEVRFLEKQIDAATAELPALKRFVLPGGGVTAARLHLARTICRRAERSLVTLMAREKIAPVVLVYVNRLSDLLFTLARLANKHDGVADVEWEPEKQET